MGKITPHKQVVHPGQTTRAGKGEISGPLKKLKEKTIDFAQGKGQRLFGAGKLASFSDTPPKTVSKRVSQSVAGTLTPARPRRK